MERPEWDDHVDRDAPHYPAAPIPLHERTWRHPSELGATSHFVSPPAEELHRGVLIAASLLGLACVIGLALVLLPGDPPADPAVLRTSTGATAEATSLTFGPTSSERPWIGALCSDGDGDAGVTVAEIEQGSPAARSGLEQGDLIVAIDGRPIDDLPTMRTVIDRSAVGDWLELSVVRQGTEHSMSVEVQASP